MPYTPPGSRRARDRSGRRREEHEHERNRTDGRGRPQTRHRPFPEFDTGNARMVGPSFLSFPIVERVEQEPLVVRRVNSEEEPGTSSEVGRRASLEEKEGAVGLSMEPILSPEHWADLSELESYDSGPKAKIRPDGAEVVIPYRWPADHRQDESQEEYESRLAEHELEAFLNPKGPMTSVCLEMVRAKQRKALKERKEPVLRKEDMESGEPTPRAQRSHSPQPGPPVRRAVETGTRPKEPHRNSRKPDPPPFCCFNCWERGHRVVDCPHPIRHQFCRNCGRRETTIRNCPRCAEAYHRFAGCPRRYEEVVETNDTRSETNEIADVMIESIVEEPPEEEERQATLDKEAPKPLVGEESENEEERGNSVHQEEHESESGDEDLVTKLLELTRALAGLPTSTVDLAVRQLLEERKKSKQKKEK
ncbi:cardiomyopathy-associated protein 5-like [Leptopilina heterotoma]|uniref:cardiomyopathy-associated protein 5-like n=1 Tax=Leptopilina heterotoma TaxID=63436 RepID=UPI001CA8A9D3|nr:cardiomyopathy-associated protein 5-like [Leptopilina heterotoma]